MAVEIVRGVEWQVGSDTHRERPEHLVDDIEILMSEALAGVRAAVATPKRVRGSSS